MLAWDNDEAEQTAIGMKGSMQHTIVHMCQMGT